MQACARSLVPCVRMFSAISSHLSAALLAAYATIGQVVKYRCPTLREARNVARVSHFGASNVGRLLD